MGARDDGMVVPRDQAAFGLGGVAPEEKYNRTRLGGEVPDHLVGERLPAPAPVGVRLTRAHGEHCIQKKDTLVRPMFEIAVVGGDDAEIAQELLVDVAKGAGDAPAHPHRKAEAVGVAWGWIRILSEQDDTYRIRRADFECREDLLSGRQDLRTRGRLMIKKGFECPVCGIVNGG